MQNRKKKKKKREGKNPHAKFYVIRYVEKSGNL